VQVRATQLRVRPYELLGAERDAIWNGVILSQIPEVANYARRARRTIPVAVLTPLEDAS